MNQNEFCSIVAKVKERLEEQNNDLPSNINPILRELLLKHLLKKANATTPKDYENLSSNNNIGVIGSFSSGKTFLINKIFNLKLPGAATEEIQLIDYNGFKIIDTPGFNRITKSVEMNENERFNIKDKEKKIESFVLKNSSVILYVVKTLNLFEVKKIQKLLKKIENKKFIILYNNTFIKNVNAYEQFKKRESILNDIKVETLIMCPYSIRNSIKRIKDIDPAKIEKSLINTENSKEKQFDETSYWKFIRLDKPGYRYYTNSENQLIIEIEAPGLTNCKIANKIIGNYTNFTIEAKKKPCYYLENGKSIINDDSYSLVIKVPLKVAVLKSSKLTKQMYQKGLVTFIYEAMQKKSESDEEEDDE